MYKSGQQQQQQQFDIFKSLMEIETERLAEFRKDKKVDIDFSKKAFKFY